MFYRETGQFKTTYAADQQIFPSPDRIGIIALLVGVRAGCRRWSPATMVQRHPDSVLPSWSWRPWAQHPDRLRRPVVAWGGAFMAVGAYGAINFQVRVEGIPILASSLAGTAAGVGILFGPPSLHQGGFLPAVATLAAQFSSSGA